MKRALVTGAGGFIGGHLIALLKGEGYWVCGADLKESAYSNAADDFVMVDLRNCDEVQHLFRARYDEVYHLAADFGGMGFIHAHETEIMGHNTRINLNVLTTAARHNVPRYFFASSVCVYRDMAIGEAALDEAGAYPALPDNEYGWEKLYAERMALAYARHYGMQVRIARFQNCYGEGSEFDGGREKAPAALCRKVARARDGESIEVWGDGRAVRSYIYVGDLVNGIRMLMDSNETHPVNIGSPEYVDVNELARRIISISGKHLKVRHVAGEVGVASRNFSNARIERLGWKCETSLNAGLARLYTWVAAETSSAENHVLGTLNHDSYSLHAV